MKSCVVPFSNLTTPLVTHAFWCRLSKTIVKDQHKFSLPALSVRWNDLVGLDIKPSQIQKRLFDYGLPSVVIQLRQTILHAIPGKITNNAHYETSYENAMQIKSRDLQADPGGN